MLKYNSTDLVQPRDDSHHLTRPQRYHNVTSYCVHCINALHFTATRTKNNHHINQVISVNANFQLITSASSLPSFKRQLKTFFPELISLALALF